MKLLISAYASAPHHGSEHAVGWNWITEAHRLGHEVWALASPAHRQAIEAACAADAALCGITWFFPEVPFWPLAEGRDAVWERTHNLLWQIAALGVARRLAQNVAFDAVHHLTWAGIRAPTFLGRLGVKLIIGPIGGGETSPPRIRQDMRLKARLTETIRDISNATIMFNPAVRGGLQKAAVIFVKTPETRTLLSRRLQAKTHQYAELTIRAEQIGAPRGDRAVQPRLLFVGRLLYWKGAHLALQAFAEIRARVPSARMTIIGQGPEEARLKAQAAALGVSDDVAFIGWLPREKVSQMYDSHDLMVFPSLHDSGGTVVLEALSRGLPVMCLDLGGPRQIVTAGSGITVETSGRNAAEVARAMSDEMLRLFAAPGLLRALSAGAVARAREFLVSSQVGRFYRTASALIGVKEESVFSSEEKNQKTFTSPLAPTSPAKPRICTLAQT
jgi:glycosyltransferase involved in cell wall biosynthesis